MSEQNQQHVLAIDVGNSRVKIGLYQTPYDIDGARVDIRQFQCLESLAVDVADKIEWSAIHSWNRTHAMPGHAIVAGSNPERMQSLLECMPGELPTPIKVDHFAKIPIEIAVDYPEKVGIDRLLNSLAVSKLKSTEKSAITISSGTATTVDVISQDGRFEGGTILPGFELCARALHQYTSLLPLIELESLPADPPKSIGNNTEAAMLSGLFWGEVGAIEKVIQLQRHEIQGSTEVFLTGGAAPLIAPHLEMEFQQIPNLALLGLVSIALIEADHA